jgi:hypothetical protein
MLVLCGAGSVYGPRRDAAPELAKVALRLLHVLRDRRRLRWVFSWPPFPILDRTMTDKISDCLVKLRAFLVFRSKVDFPRRATFVPRGNELLEDRVMPTLVISGSAHDKALFQQMINTAKNYSVFRTYYNQIEQAKGKVVVDLKGGKHNNFVDQFKSNDVYVSDLQNSDVPVSSPGNNFSSQPDLRTQAELILHFLEERYFEAQNPKLKGDELFEQAFANALGPDNQLRAQLQQPAIDVKPTVDYRTTWIKWLHTNEIQFVDGATWNAYSNGYDKKTNTVKWKIITTPPTKSQSPPPSGSYYITWILGPLLSDNSDAYANVAFPASNVAEFAASDKNGPVTNPGDFTAIILWGDGTSSQGQVVNYQEGGYVYPTEFVVLGSHAYAEAGNYNIQVQIVQASGYSENNAIVNEAAVDDWSSVSWQAAPSIPKSKPEVGFSDAVIGVFLASLDGQPDPNLDDFQASIDWGDGSTSIGEIERDDGAGDPSNEYLVSASHTYQQAGNYSIQTQITGGGDFTQDDTDDSSADVIG